ncbi:MAG: response regulator, partial [Gammaproteobacteria bacterium]
GLGLSISRKLAHALGGDITVNSEQGKGSVFTATIATGPLADIRLLEGQELLAAQQETEPDSNTHWEFPPARVLVVDDGDENRELLKLVLEEAGLMVECAENGKLAVGKAMHTAFDIIYMDIQMPVMDGSTATSYLRQQGLQTPIIALTAHAMKGFEKDIMGVGFTGYMTKPIDIDGIIQMTADLLGGKRVENAQPAHMPAAVVPAPAEPVMTDKAPLVSRLPAGNPRFQAIIRKFVGRLDEQVRAMEQAWQERNYSELANLAHWLKGSGGTVGFDAFTKPAGALEQLAKEKCEDRIEARLLEICELARRVEMPEAGASEDIQISA